jgi:hypothetical protein
MREVDIMTAQERLETALHSPDPGACFRALIGDLAHEGLTKPQIYELLEKFVLQLRLRTDYRDVDEELVLDIMDALNGWCHPSAELLPDEPIA